MPAIGKWIGAGKWMLGWALDLFLAGLLGFLVGVGVVWAGAFLWAASLGALVDALAPRSADRGKVAQDLANAMGYIQFFAAGAILLAFRIRRHRKRLRLDPWGRRMPPPPDKPKLDPWGRPIEPPQDEPAKE